ncbi:hypothetical protein RclHR1_07200003 [Rhizophagus clarus]|uniref:Uncharacterized protein n=1 Tax=Rhizophagus clarus TaxID=94130 RepID=A0A2Z6S7X8_9GLOM|nr:hypothetical protein RclHR1_07200003 [Rhizophagus clarus]
MEGVENINSVNTGGTSTASTESQGTLNNLQQQTTARFEASIHAQAHTITTTTVTSSQQNDTNKTQSCWTVIGKSQKITLFFPLDLVSGQNNTEKKNHVFCHVVELTRIFSTITIKGVKMIKVVCETEDAANKVMAKTIVIDNPTKFNLAGALKEEWSMKFLNKTFKIFPSTLTKEKRNHRFNIDDMNAAKENHFAFNNKGLHFADKNALTCHVYGSINHKVRNCSKNNQLKRCYGQQTAYQDIYKRYKVEVPKPKFGFKPIFPSAKDDFISSNMNWADDWNAEFSAKPTPPVSYAKVTQ